MQSENSIEVAIRLQPPPSSHLISHPSQLKCGTKIFSFDYIFPPQATQDEIFLKLGTKIVSNVKKGYNSCIFAYGQTGSGKTYTMTGNNQQNGLIQNCIKSLWDVLQQYENFQVKVSYYEIYNEQIFDLLVDHKKVKKQNVPLIKIKESLALGFYLQNIKEVKAQNQEQILFELKTGLANRSTAETRMNSVSSRSHSIFTLKIQMRQEKESVTKIKSAKIHFVDLAGSEKQKHSQTIGDKLKEASNINKSLTLLSLVIEKLANKANHIPYRDSAVTKILRDSLGGNSKTILLGTISGKKQSFSQTLSTLNFAAKAKNIKLSAKVNEEIDGGSMKDLYKKIKQLEDELKILKNKDQCDTCSIWEQEYEKIERKNEELQQQLKSIIKQKENQRMSEKYIILQNKLQIQNLQMQELERKIAESSERYRQVLEDFRKNLKNINFKKVQEIIMLMHIKKIKQLESTINQERQLFERKEDGYKQSMLKLERLFERVKNKELEVNSSEEPHKILHEKRKLEEKLEEIEIIRTKQKKQKEEIQNINASLKNQLQQKQEEFLFIKEVLSDQIEEINHQLSLERNQYEKNLKRQKEKSQWEKNNLLQEYEQKLKKKIQQVKQVKRIFSQQMQQWKETEKISQMSQFYQEKNKISIRQTTLKAQCESLIHKNKQILILLHEEKFKNENSKNDTQTLQKQIQELKKLIKGERKDSLSELQKIKEENKQLIKMNNQYLGLQQNLEGRINVVKSIEQYFVSKIGPLLEVQVDLSNSKESIERIESKIKEMVKQIEDLKIWVELFEQNE